MKTRIIFVAVILGSLTVCGLNGIKFSQLVARLRLEAQTEKDSRSKAEAELVGAKVVLRKAGEAAQDATMAVKAAEIERNNALAAVVVQGRRSEMLAQELTLARHDLVETQVALANPTEFPERQLAGLAGRIEQLEAALSKARQENFALTRAVRHMSEKLPLEPCIWSMPDLKGKVVAVDPKWQFFVLDAGEDQGALERGELLVNRNGKLIAKVVIRRVQKDYSIGSIVPGWSLGEIKEGDSFVTVTN